MNRRLVNFVQTILKEGVILRGVHAFGLPDGVRITNERKKEMNRLEHAFKKVMSKLSD